MDSSIQWNIALCNLIPSGAPFMQPGMSSICPLKAVMLFVLQLTKRANYSSTSQSIYLPLSFEINKNSIYVYIPPRVPNPLPYLVGIDGHLKQFCEQFRSSSNPGCVIYPAIRQLLTIPNLHMLYS